MGAEQVEQTVGIGIAMAWSWPELRPDRTIQHNAPW